MRDYWLAQLTDADTSEETSEEDSENEGSPESEAEGDLLRITVTGTRTPRTVQSAPATTTVFDAEDIDRLLIRDIGDLIRYEPGVSVQNNQQFGLQDFNIRGIDGNRVLIQVDGIRLPSAFQSGDEVVAGQGFNLGRDYFDLEILQTAEIIRGPASTLYGSDALGGAVSYFTLTPGSLLDAAERDAVTAVSTNFDTQNSGFASTVVQASRFNDLELLLAYTRRDSSEAENLRDDQDNDRNNFLGRLVYQLSETSAVNFTAEIFDNTTDTLTADENLALITGTTTRFEETIDTNRTRLSLGYEYDNPDSASFLDFAQAQIYVQDARTREENERELLGFDFRTFQAFPALRVGENRFRDRVFGGNLQLRSDFDWGATAHRLTYGFDISNTFNSRPRDRTQTNLITDTITQDAIPDNFPTKDFPDSDTFRVGVYVQDEIELGRFSLIPGLRFDYYDLSVDSDADFERNGAIAAEFSDSAFSPNIALVYQPSDQISLYGRYSRGFRAPLYNEVNSGFTNQIFGYRTEPNPDLDAETSNSFEVGVRGNFPQLNFSLAGFYNRYNDFIDFQLIDTEFVGGRPFSVFQNVNIDKAETYGVEAKAEYRFSPGLDGFSLLGALSWTIGNNLTTDEPLTTVDPIEAVLGLRYRAPEDRWGAELITTLVGQARGEGFDPEPGQDPFVADGFSVWDLIGYYRVSPSLTFNAGLFNLFDTDYVTYSDTRFLDRNESLFPLRRNRFEQPGLNASIGLSWQF
ncbi:MAG: TonB-dependent hemoglobin/transferrin/lactoferrin family receptor [Cyanobacteria bacterium P01_A01_bin.114]